jgi:Ca2+-binding EF-hand superfamily protein
MGTSGSSLGRGHGLKFEPRSDRPGQTEAVYKMMERLSLKRKDINGLYAAFRKIDIDDYGHIKIDELAEEFRLPQLADHLLRLVWLTGDSDNTGTLTFSDFVQFIWTFST